MTLTLRPASLPSTPTQACVPALPTSSLMAFSYGKAHRIALCAGRPYTQRYHDILSKRTGRGTQLQPHSCLEPSCALGVMGRLRTLTSWAMHQTHSTP